jgi:hypothetical protein
MTNPFCASSLLNLPLTIDVCQQIHAEALLRISHTSAVEHMIPESVDGSLLRELRLRLGPAICLAHPKEVEQLFCGVTLLVYQQIEALYCSRIARSIRMVTRILTAMARAAQAPLIHEEAIWAICLYLDERRREHTRVTTQQTSAVWWIGTIVTDEQDQPLLVGLIDLSCLRVLAFRVGPCQFREELYTLTLYDALLATRHPDREAAGGVAWQVPTALISPDPLAFGCHLACAELRVRIEQRRTGVPLVGDLRELWMKQQRHLKIAPEQRTVAFDSALNRAYGTSPLRTREQADYRFRHLKGYQSDPASLVPGIRALLPSQKAEILQEGEVLFDGLHYTDELLSYFPGSLVEVALSKHSEATMWVSLDGEILTKAMARELARRDGSYRSHRPGR